MAKTFIGNIKGPKGDKGDKGDPGTGSGSGTAATISIGSVTTGAAGSSASVTNSGTTSAAVLDFVIPKGDKGEKGDKGDTGATGAQGVQGVKGDTGATGAAGTAATISIGTVTTGAAGTSASVTNVGTSTNAKLNFVIPKGDKGEQGTSSEFSGTHEDLPGLLGGNTNEHYHLTQEQSEWLISEMKRPIIGPTCKYELSIIVSNNILTNIHEGKKISASNVSINKNGVTEVEWDVIGATYSDEVFIDGSKKYEGYLIDSYQGETFANISLFLGNSSGSGKIYPYIFCYYSSRPGDPFPDSVFKTYTIPVRVRTNFGVDFQYIDITLKKAD